MAPLLFHASAKQQISYGVDCWALDIGFSAENKSPHWIEKVEIRVFLGKKRGGFRVFHTFAFFSFCFESAGGFGGSGKSMNEDGFQKKRGKKFEYALD